MNRRGKILFVLSMLLAIPVGAAVAIVVQKLSQPPRSRVRSTADTARGRETSRTPPERRSPEVRVPGRPEPEEPLPTTNAVAIVSIGYAADDEYVEIRNDGPYDQDMDGWEIESGAGHQRYIFPAGYLLRAGSTVKVHSGPEADHSPPIDLLWTQGYVWNNQGDEAILRDNLGRVIDRWSY